MILWLCVGFFSVFMLHVLLQVGLHHSVGQCGDLSICRHSALLTPLTIASKKQWHQMVDLHCIELLLLWHELNAPWWACGSCSCSGLCPGKCDNRLHASHWWHLCSGDMCSLSWSMPFCPVDETCQSAHDEEPVEAELCIECWWLLSLDKELDVPFFWICKWCDCCKICHSKT